LEALVTDPDLIFDLDPQNLQRVESWISLRWPGVPIAKQSDGSRLTWTLTAPLDAVASVVTTESFLSLPASEVEQQLAAADRLCDAASAGATCCLLLTVDGARTLPVAMLR
jgi:hypothetical protein